VIVRHHDVVLCKSVVMVLLTFSVTLNAKMNYVRNHENLLNSVKVMLRILSVLFFPDAAWFTKTLRRRRSWQTVVCGSIALPAELCQRQPYENACCSSCRVRGWPLDRSPGKINASFFDLHQHTRHPRSAVGGCCWVYLPGYMRSPRSQHCFAYRGREGGRYFVQRCHPLLHDLAAALRNELDRCTWRDVTVNN